MAFDGFLSALAAVIPALFLAAGVYIYVALVRQISVRVVEPSATPVRGFGWPEATLATVLVLIFLRSIAVSTSRDVSGIQTRDLLASALFSIGLLLFIATFLRLRRLDLNSLGGFSKIGFGRAVITGGNSAARRVPVGSSRGGCDSKTCTWDPGKAGNHRDLQRLEYVGAADLDNFVSGNRSSRRRGILLPVFFVRRGETILRSRSGSGGKCSAFRRRTRSSSLVCAALRPRNLLRDRLRMERFPSRFHDDARVL